jgi:formate dehydrogenase major subunit/formate dehydrogenase alpha subunit
MTIRLTINSKEIITEEGQTVLEAARQNGITIPTLCYHKDLSPVGSCRLCLVEVEKWRGLTAACTLAASDGMVVHTESPTIFEARKTVLDLLLLNYSDAGYGEFDGHDTEFKHWVKAYGASLPAGYKPQPKYPVDSDPNPFVWVDLNKCILCTRCVRACAEIQGRFVWGVGYRGHEAKIIAGEDTTMLEARCESCGACAAYCPTGALDHKLSVGAGTADRLVTTTCTYCGVGCQFDLNVKDDRVIRVTSNPDAPVNGMHLCVKGRYGFDFIHHPDRLLAPKVRRYLLEGGAKPPGDQRSPSSSRPIPWDWVEVSWETALDIAAQKLTRTRQTHGSDSIGVLTSAKCLNEENYLMNKFARQVVGTNNIDHCARL